MTESIMVIFHGLTVLIFGVFLSSSFANIEFTKKNTFIILTLCALLAAFQGILMYLFNEELLWKMYPIITHLPLMLFLTFFFKKRLLTVTVSIFTAYLLCQPAKWFGVFSYSISNNKTFEYCTRITLLILLFILILKFVSRTFAEIFEKDARNICIFAIVPTVYYLFDYITVIYTNAWLENNRIAAEFLPFFLCIIFTVFCIVYYREYEKKADAERKENIIRITVEQQAKELEAIKRSESEVRILRHDLRLFLSTLAVCVETDDKDTARHIINSYTEQVERSKAKRFCANDTINYVISDFFAKCEAHEISFNNSVGIDKISVDEILFSSILQNALDNALNAVLELPPEQRTIHLVIRMINGKLLLSVKNSMGKKAVFSDGHPISTKKGHGYGTQSMRYLTEKLGGNCQFTTNDEYFITRVII